MQEDRPSVSKKAAMLTRLRLSRLELERPVRNKFTLRQEHPTGKTLRKTTRSPSMPFTAALKSVLLSAALLFAGTATITPAEAAPVEACAKYRRQNGTWSHVYKVKGEVLPGAEMNVHAKKRTYDEGAHY